MATRPPSPALLNATYLPSPEIAGARNGPGSTGSEPACVPSSPTSPAKAPPPLPPLWTSNRVGSTHCQYIGEPFRTMVAAAHPVGRGAAQGEPVRFGREEAERPAVRRPVEVEDRLGLARVDGRRRGDTVTGLAADGEREDVEAGPAAVGADGGDSRGVRRPGRELEGRTGRRARGRWTPGRRP